MAVVGHLNTQAGASRNIKPSAWPWSPSSVRPEWQSLLKGLVFAVPLWRDYRDYISRIQGTPDSGTGWSTSASGVSYKNAEDKGLNWGSNGSVWRPAGDKEWSIFVACHVLALFDGLINYYFITQATGEVVNGGWHLYRSILSNDMAFRWIVSGGAQLVQWTDSWKPTRPYALSAGDLHPEILRSYLVTRKIGGTYELWNQGISAGTQSNATAPVDTGTHALSIGNLDGAPTKGLTAHWMTGMIWNRALTDREARGLGEDPYGLWRPPRGYLG